MSRHLHYKVMVFISVVLIAVALLAANSIGILLDIKRDADVQIRDANQVVFNADFDVALARAAGEATSSVATKREDALNQAGDDVAHAHLALDGLRNTTGDKPPIEGLEGKRRGFITGQRMTSAVIERDLEVAQTLRTDTETTALRRLLDVVYAHVQNANLLREDISSHGKLETAATARGLQGDAPKILHALIAILTVLVLIIGFGLIFTSRRIFKPINRLTIAASAVAQGDFNQRVALSAKGEIKQLQTAFNQIVNELDGSNQRLSLALENSDTAIWDWDIAKDTIFISEGWSVMLGGPRQATYTSFSALTLLVHPTELDGLRERIVAMLKGDTTAYSVEHPRKK